MLLDPYQEHVFQKGGNILSRHDPPKSINNNRLNTPSDVITRRHSCSREAVILLLFARTEDQRPLSTEILPLEK